MIFLIDHNLKGHALILMGNITNSGWLEFVSLQFMTFEEVSLPINSDEPAGISPSASASCVAICSK